MKSFLQSLWCGCWGVVYVGFYALQTRLFGSGSDFATLAAKTTFDQFVWSPFLPVPCTAFFCLWMEGGFSLHTAAEVAAQFAGSRRLAELRFREAFGHSILDEIQNVRMEKVQFLLAKTDTPIAAIAVGGGGDGDRIGGDML